MRAPRPGVKARANQPRYWSEAVEVVAIEDAASVRGEYWICQDILLVSIYRTGEGDCTDFVRRMIRRGVVPMERGEGRGRAAGPGVDLPGSIWARNQATGRRGYQNEIRNVREADFEDCDFYSGGSFWFFCCGRILLHEFLKHSVLTLFNRYHILPYFFRISRILESLFVFCREPAPCVEFCFFFCT